MYYYYYYYYYYYSNAHRILVEKPQERDHLEDPDKYGRTILKWI